MAEQVFQVASQCKKADCPGVLVYEETDGFEKAKAYLASERPHDLTCEVCSRTYQYAPTKDEAFVRPKPTDRERLQVF